MNKIFILATLAFVAAIFTLGSCDKTDGISIVPKFSSITCDPESPAAGDTMTLTAHQSVQGKLIYSATYKWASTARQLYVNLTASYGLSGQTEEGQIFGQAITSGTVNIQQ